MGIILYNFKNLNSLENRINKIQLVKRPPTLRMIQINHERQIQEVTPPYEREITPEEMAEDPYALVIQIDAKPEDWDKE